MNSTDISKYARSMAPTIFICGYTKGYEVRLFAGSAAAPKDDVFVSMMSYFPKLKRWAK
jgi:hypothetical protein